MGKAHVMWGLNKDGVMNNTTICIFSTQAKLFYLIRLLFDVKDIDVDILISDKNALNHVRVYLSIREILLIFDYFRDNSGNSLNGNSLTCT